VIDPEQEFREAWRRPRPPSLARELAAAAIVIVLFPPLIAWVAVSALGGR